MSEGNIAMKWFLNLKISKKLLVGLMLIASMSAITSLIGYKTIKQIASNASTMYADRLVPIRDLSAAKADLLEMRGDSLALISTSDQEQRQQYTDSIRSADEALEARIGDYSRTYLVEKEKTALEAFKHNWSNYRELRDQALSLAIAGNGSQARKVFDGPARQARLAAETSLDEMISVCTQIAKELVEDNDTASRAAVIKVTLTGVAAILLALGTGLLLSRIISRPLQLVAERVEKLRSLCITNVGAAAEAMAEGQLDIEIVTGTEPLPVESNDEVGQLAQSVNGIIQQTKATVASFEKVIQVIRELTTETASLVQSATDGNLQRRGNQAKFSGGYAELIGGLNATLDAMTQPIGEASEVLAKVADRDLTARMTGDFRGDFARIKDSLNRAVENLEESLSQVSTGAEQVASAATQISSGSQNMAQGSSEQASSLQEVTASLEEVNSMATQNASNAREVEATTVSARDSALKGLNSMKRLSDAIGRIKSSSDETARIVKTIDEIAFQTNLLALNAAVEAARAGDAGKGFAVVAEEVRNLAMRSAEAAKSTSDLIAESVNNSNEGVSINTEVLKHLEEIHQQVDRVSESVREIAAASDQQKDGVHQVHATVEQLNQVTQSTAANAEESASVAEELSSQSATLSDLVLRFQIGQRLQAPLLSEKAPNRPVLSRSMLADSHPRKNGSGNRNGRAFLKLEPEGFQLAERPEEFSDF